MGLISRVSSRTYRSFDKKSIPWLSISTGCYQTPISASERRGLVSPRPGSTSRPRRSLADRPVPPRQQPSPHDRSPVLYDQSSSAQPSDTTPRLESAEVSPTTKSRAQV